MTEFKIMFETELKKNSPTLLQGALQEYIFHNKHML
jgi:hypothetical protein